MPAKDCPCRGCLERCEACHGSCERYQTWKKEYEQVKETYRMEHQRPPFPNALVKYVYRRMKEGRMRK